MNTPLNNNLIYSISTWIHLSIMTFSLQGGRGRLWVAASAPSTRLRGTSTTPAVTQPAAALLLLRVTIKKIIPRYTDKKVSFSIQLRKFLKRRKFSHKLWSVNYQFLKVFLFSMIKYNNTYKRFKNIYQLISCQGKLRLNWLSLSEKVSIVHVIPKLSLQCCSDPAPCMDPGIQARWGIPSFIF